MQVAVSRRVAFDPQFPHNSGKAELIAQYDGAVAVADIELPFRPVPSADLVLHLANADDLFPRERSEALSRTVNVAIAAIALIVLLPVLALIALAIALTSSGPVIYQQSRVGVDRRFRRKRTSDRRGYDHGGKLFEMYKFRSMRTDAESDGTAVWASQNDPRVTAVGAILRKTRLDELPQLINVLKGDMNIVGPRPERPSIFAKLREDIPHYPIRQRVKPGITGWAQINQSYDSCVEDVRRKVHYDLEYLKNQCMLEDLRIMSMTLPVMLFRRGGW
jgi:lipopolysaccharide/colanic/teichoic acid biosynthesis glycosyltransferase